MTGQSLASEIFSPQPDTIPAAPHKGTLSHPLIELRNVSRSFGGQNPTVALKSANLTVHSGDFVAIVGPSGAGKSTLLNILGLLDTPTSGMYYIDGVDSTLLSERERDQLRSKTFGFIFQSSHVLMDESVSVNAALGLRIQGVKRPDRTHAAARSLRQVGLLPRAQSIGRSLSGGERQRLALSRAIATSPKLLLADEPTGNLDSANSAIVIAKLEELNSLGVTIIVITHDPTVAAAAKRRVHLADGLLTDPVSDAASLSSQGSGSLAFTQEKPSPRQHRKDRVPSRPLTSWLDDLSDALSALTARPIRALILILAFLLGTGGLVASVGLSETASAQVSQRLAQAALDEVQVQLGDFPDTNTENLSEESNRDKILALDGVTAVGLRSDAAPSDAPVSLLPPGSFDDQPDFSGRVLSADSHLLPLYDSKVWPDGSPSLLDNTVGAKVAIVGSNAAEQLGIASPGPGSVIWIGNQQVNVVGILTDAPRDTLMLSSIIVNSTVAEAIPNMQTKYIVRTLPGFPAPLADAIPLAIDPANPDSVKITTVADLRALRYGVATDMGTYVAVISWILLALASLSAATSMYLTVQSRAPEIALRRALGSTRGSVRRIFMIEGAIIGVAGGIAGAACGLAAVVAVSAVQNWTPVLGIQSLVIGIVAGATTGILSSAYPAISAARANPAEKIRG